MARASKVSSSSFESRRAWVYRTASLLIGIFQGSALQKLSARPTDDSTLSLFCKGNDRQAWVSSSGRLQMS